MTDVDDEGRPEPPLAGTELETLTGFLDFLRATLAWKCDGLDAVALRTTVGRSSMTLGGLLKHLAYVEDDWFDRWLLGRDRRPPWDVVDWAADPDWEWHSAAQDSPEQLLALWRGAVERSRDAVAEATARRRVGSTQSTPVARRPRPESAVDLDTHDRGVRPALRPCRPAARIDRRKHRRIAPPNYAL